MAPKPSSSCRPDLFCSHDAAHLDFCLVSRLAVFRAGTGFYSKLCCCSVAKSCLTLCDPVGSSMPGSPILHYHLEFAQTYVLWVSDAIQPSHSLSPPFLLLSSILPTSGAFPVSRLFISGDQSVGALASASVFPMNIQDWFSLGLTGLISLQSKRLSRVFSNTTVQKHQFFGAQLSL